MNRRRALGAVVALTGAPGALAENPVVIRRIAILDQWYTRSATGPARKLVESLAQEGYREGRNIAFEWRHAAGDHARLARVAGEIAAMRPDAIVTMGGISTGAVARATSTIPVVAWVEDPVKTDIAHPSLLPKRNITGIVDRADERTRKGLELVKAMIPGMSVFGALLPERDEFATQFIQAVEAHANSLGLRIAIERFASRVDIEHGLARLAASGARVAVAWPAPGLATVPETVRLALGHRIGLVSEGIGARFGVLLSFSPEIDTRRMAAQLDRIFRGTPVARIPFEHSDRFILSINRKTATALGLAIPDAIHLRAQEIFDDWEEAPAALPRT